MFDILEEVLLELLEAVWASKVISRLSLGCSLLVEVVFGEGVTGFFFTSSLSFWATISKAVLSLGLRLAYLVVGSLSKGIYILISQNMLPFLN